MCYNVHMKKKAELTRIGKLYESELSKHYNEGNVIGFLHRRRLPTHKVVTNIVADTNGEIDANFVYGFFLGFEEYITGKKRVYKYPAEIGNVDHRLHRDNTLPPIKGYRIWECSGDEIRLKGRNG